MRFILLGNEIHTFRKKYEIHIKFTYYKLELLGNEILCLVTVLIIQFLFLFQWADLCTAYLLEAKWYHTRYTPTLQEYLSNASFSISGPVILLHAYLFVTNTITEEALECFERNSNIIRWSSLIVRLIDDLGTSSVCNICPLFLLFIII